MKLLSPLGLEDEPIQVEFTPAEALVLWDYLEKFVVGSWESIPIPERVVLNNLRGWLEQVMARPDKAYAPNAREIWEQARREVQGDLE